MSKLKFDLAQLFEAHLEGLGLTSLDAHDRKRLLQSYMKQKMISDGYDKNVAVPSRMIT